jgi:metal-responsive CopG/Arc/MetJ family transcriptional regulator
MMKNKERFSISMDKVLIKKLDAEVQRGKYASRSQAIEVCVKQKISLDETDERIGEFLFDLMDLAAKRPELVEEYKKALRNVD